MNRREDYRISMHNLETRATVVIDGHVALFRVQLSDLSASGARLISTRPLAAGGALRLHLPAWDGGPALDIPARVAWSANADPGWELGIRFTGAPPAVCEQIRRRVTAEQRRELARRVAFR